MELKTLQTNFERELLFQIIYKMRHNKLTRVRARKVAKAFLPTLKFNSAEEFIAKNATLSEFYPEILEAFLVTVNDYEKETKGKNLIQIRNKLIGGGN